MSKFKNCPLVWDTGALFGFMPFRNNLLTTLNSAPWAMIFLEQTLSLALYTAEAHDMQQLGWLENTYQRGNTEHISKRKHRRNKAHRTSFTMKFSSQSPNGQTQKHEQQDNNGLPFWKAVTNTNTYIKVQNIHTWYLSQISQMRYVETNLSCGEMSDFDAR